MGTLDVLDQPAPGRMEERPAIVNDFSISIATVNGSGSQTANGLLARAMFKMGIPVTPKNFFPSNISGLPTWYVIRLSKEYGIQDTMMALHETRLKGIQTFCLTVDPKGHDYLRAMCPDQQYLVLEDMASLPKELPKVYRSLTT